MNGDESAFWLMVMNYAIGAVVIVAWVGVIAAVIWELSSRKWQKIHSSEATDESLRAVQRPGSLHLPAPRLAVTWADASQKEGPTGAVSGVPRPRSRGAAAGEAEG